MPATSSDSPTSTATGAATIYSRGHVGLTSLVNAPDPTSIRWDPRTSSGTGFRAVATLATDATDDGDIVP